MKYKQAYLILTLFAILVIGCNKNKETVTKESLSIITAKEFYNNALLKKVVSFSSINPSLNPNYNPRLPKWDEVFIHVIGDEQIIEVPLTFKYNRGLQLQEGLMSQVKDPEKLNLKKLIIIKRKDGSYSGSIMTVISKSIGSLKYNDISYKTIKFDFNGIILFHDLNDNFLTGWRYENGKVIKIISQETFRSEPKQNIEGLSLTDPSHDCYTVIVTRWCEDCIDWYVNGVYDRTSCGTAYICGQYSYQECETSGGGGVPVDGGGTGTPPPQEPCNAPSPAEILAGGVSIIDGPVSIKAITPQSTNSYGETTRTMDYIWEFYRGTWLAFSWTYFSLDRGEHIKVGNQWHWKTLTHISEGTTGTTPADTKLKLATPLITIIDYNRASIKINYTITCTVTCFGAIIASENFSGEGKNSSLRANSY